MLRRDALFGLAGLTAAGVIGSPVEARAEDIAPVPGGTTFTFQPKSAPFPCKGGAYEDSSVHLFVPDRYRLPESRKVDAVVHYHGHNTTAAHAMPAHKLREQLVESKQNAVLIVPQGPVNAADSDFGKLMTKAGLRNLIDEVLDLASKRKASAKLGDASLAEASAVGRVVVSGHSGGYHPAAAAIRRGSVDLREVYLFDALYDEIEAFAGFVQASGPKRKLVSYSIAGRPLANSSKLARLLESKGVEVVEESAAKRATREELVKGRAIFLLGKATHASAPYEERALRDCLITSCLVGHGSKPWLSQKSVKR